MTPSTDKDTQEPAGTSTDRLERRKRLRQFQADLVERMQAARDQTDAVDNRLGVLVGRDRWLLNLQETGEVVPVGSLTQVPLTQDWYLGLVNLRGNLVSVIDFARYQGYDPTPIEPGCRIITFTASLGFNCGLLVSRVLGLRNVATLDARDAPGDGAPPWAGERFVDNDGQEWGSLSFAAIAQENRFLHIGL